MVSREISITEVKNRIQEEKIETVTLKTLDLAGRLHHLHLPAEHIEESYLSGVGFDGSSYRFASVEQSDMVLVPDLNSVHFDTFRKVPTLGFFTKIMATTPARAPFAQDTRGVAIRAEAYLKEQGIADVSLWAPEYEFYILDKVEYHAHENSAYYFVESEENIFENAYHAANPFDRHADFRDEALRVLTRYGIPVRYHHHETGKKGQQEIEGLFNPLTVTGDHAVLFKYIVFNLAKQFGVRVTFMPKPLYNHAGSGWHLHHYLTKGGGNIFYEKGAYGNLGKTAHHYIGGVLRHAPALAAFTNPSTNSYKRMVPGFEAPVAITFGLANRSGAVRIPSYVTEPELTRVEYRPSDFTCNPYLCTSAILMAGADGVSNKIDPVAEGFGPYDTNVSEHEETKKKVKLLPGSLELALDALEKDHEFLSRGGVFSPELIAQWIKVKRAEISAIATRPHPFEFVMYFDF
jgi:glutamine synthetase